MKHVIFCFDRYFLISNYGLLIFSIISLLFFSFDFKDQERNLRTFPFPSENMELSFHCENPVEKVCSNSKKVKVFSRKKKKKEILSRIYVIFHSVFFKKQNEKKDCLCNFSPEIFLNPTCEFFGRHSDEFKIKTQMINSIIF